MSANLKNSAVAAGLENVSFHSNSKERPCQRMLKLLTIALLSHASKVMLKILQARLQQYMNCELPDVQVRFRKGRGIRDQIANIHWIIEKVRASGGDGIPGEVFQILKDVVVKVFSLNMPANLENSAVATGLKKVSFHSNPKEGQCQRMFKQSLQLRSFHTLAR